MAGRRWCRNVLLVALSAACSTPGYAPYPLDLQCSLPSDAFARCRAVLLDRYGTLLHVDEGGFRLQTAWQPTADPPGERRASVFRDDVREQSLVIIVELRRLTVPWFGPPHWTSSRGDDRAERELAGWLQASLQDPVAPGFPQPEDQPEDRGSPLGK